MSRGLAPFIGYIPYEGMIRCPDLDPFIPRLAYCNLRVCYWQRIRKKITKEISVTSSRPYDDMKAYFEDVRDTWSRSEACTRLKYTLESVRPRCNKIVAFALGEMCQEVNSDMLRGVQEGAAFQHAMILSLRDALSRPNSENIACYAQDPAYSEVDKTLLRDYDIKAVDDPEGFLQVDNSSAVISCSPDVPIREIIADIACPALIIWNKIKDIATQPMRYSDVTKEFLALLMFRSTDPVSRRVREMIETQYYRMEFPGDEKHFGELAVYARRS